MKRILLHLSLAVASICLGVVTIFAVGKPPQSEYATMVAKLKAGDTSINFTELRTAYADSPQYDDEPDADLRKEMFSALQAKEYAKAIKVANKALHEDFLDINAHQALFLAYRDTHQDKKAKFHHDIVKGLIRSILNSGDGKTKESAYVVNSTEEEYVILKVMGLQFRKQSLIETNQHFDDELMATNPVTRATVTLYFNIDRPMRAMANLLKRN